MPIGSFQTKHCSTYFPILPSTLLLQSLLQVSLESVDLDEVGKEAAGLEEFLNEDCPGIEALPKD